MAARIKRPLATLRHISTNAPRLNPAEAGWWTDAMDREFRVCNPRRLHWARPVTPQEELAYYAVFGGKPDGMSRVIALVKFDPDNPLNIRRRFTRMPGDQDWRGFLEREVATMWETAPDPATVRPKKPRPKAAA